MPAACVSGDGSRFFAFTTFNLPNVAWCGPCINGCVAHVSFRRYLLQLFLRTLWRMFRALFALDTREFEGVRAVFLNNLCKESTLAC